MERVVVISPRGFCAGVVRAIATVERALEIFAPPVYVRRAIVHNADVVARLSAAGATFVDELDDVPAGSVVVFSAHGVAPAVREQARARHLRIVDATCPLVAKVHREVIRYSEQGYQVLLVGHAGHDEVIGTLGQAPCVRLVEPGSDVSRLSGVDPERVALVTQTTLSPQDVGPLVHQLRKKFPLLVEPAAADICYATRNRQAAITSLARGVDVVLVVGDRTSSNSRRLREAASAMGTPAYLVSSAADIQEAWLADINLVGVSAGASTPERLVTDVVDFLRRKGAAVEERAHVTERMSFGLPRELTLLPTA